MSFCFEFSLICTSTKTHLTVFSIKPILSHIFLSMLVISEYTQFQSQSPSSSFCHFSSAQSDWALNTADSMTDMFIRSTFHLPSTGSPVTGIIEFFSIRISESTTSIYSHCLQICVQGKVIPREACQFTIFFCWLRLLFQMTILGIRLDGMPVENIAYVWARCSYAGLPLFSVGFLWMA